MKEKRGLLAIVLVEPHVEHEWQREHEKGDVEADRDDGKTDVAPSPPGRLTLCAAATDCICGFGRFRATARSEYVEHGERGEDEHERERHQRRVEQIEQGQPAYAYVK